MEAVLIFSLLTTGYYLSHNRKDRDINKDNVYEFRLKSMYA